MVIERSESESSLSVCRFQDIPSTTKSQDAQVSDGGLCIQSSASIDSTKDSSYSTGFIKKKKKKIPHTNGLHSSSTETYVV